MMVASDAEFLDTLAACLDAGVPLPDALSRIDAAGVTASRWVRRVRPFVRPGTSVENVLGAASVIDATEQAILALAVAPDDAGRLLHAFAIHRRRRESLAAAVRGGLVGPFVIAVLTVVLEPLPNLLGAGSYVEPVLHGLGALGFATALVVVGVPWALRSPRIGTRLLSVCSALPGIAYFAARHAEAELVTVSGLFAARPLGGRVGMLAASRLLSWAPLGQRIHAGSLAADTTSDAAITRLAPYLSLETNLSVVSGIASGRLGENLAARGEEIAVALSTRLRFAVRIAAYVLVVVLSFPSMANMLSHALPGSALPGATPSAEQKELDEIMKELNGAVPPPPGK